MSSPQPRDTDFSERIRSVLEARDMTILALQQALERAGADNSGYSSVRRYVKGRFPPSVAWVDAAARELYVNPAWLAFGEVVGRKRPDGRDPPAGGPIGASMAMATGMTTTQPDHAGQDPMNALVEDLMIALVEALVRAEPNNAPELTEKDLGILTLRLSFAVGGILWAVRPDQAGRDPAGAALGVLNAVLGYVPAKGEGRPVTEVTDLLPTWSPPTHDEGIEQ